ncbi:DMT family transporter [Tomitella fengzijianii]|uniref:QacE family quaternary ammonium compound efflux SMR transporter n=1 Tax=Tomitella fengzijianii TaxID=2597660 RepID=A0A516WZ09_9ACTN|nr:SMR family transporter [Tomitella fengzijianii]QDQ96035.1 QacE family quaternary ammonium compound efflux SMR transporter [Tomitella fengzijianii]
MNRWLVLAGAIGAEVLGTMSLRAATEHAAWYALVVAAYITAFALLSWLLRSGLPIGVVYGIWGASGVALTAVLATVIFGETLSAAAIAGIALIIVGVVLVETGSPDSGRDASERVP